MKIYCNYCGKPYILRDFRKRFCSMKCKGDFWRNVSRRHKRMELNDLKKDHRSER